MPYAKPVTVTKGISDISNTRYSSLTNRSSKPNETNLSLNHILPMGLKESSYFVPGFRRYLGARKRIGGIFFRMHTENVPQVQDLTALSKVFNTDPDTIKKHGFFRVYE